MLNPASGGPPKIAAKLSPSMSEGMRKTLSSSSKRLSKILRNPGRWAGVGFLYNVQCRVRVHIFMIMTCVLVFVVINGKSRDLPAVDHDAIDCLRAAWWGREPVP